MTTNGKNAGQNTDLGVSRRRFLSAAAGAAAGGAAMAAATGTAQAQTAGPAPRDMSAPNPNAPLRELTGRTIFITGGSSGIGLGIARAAAEAGMNVVITYRTQSNLEEAMEFFEPGAPVHAIHLDVTDREGFVRAADEAEEVFGPVNLLCNNAGVGILTAITAATYNDWDFGLGVNVGGVVNGVQTFVPRMIARREEVPAHIVTTSSMGGVFPGGQAGIYTTTKFAVTGMMEALRAEMDPRGIGVSAFCPGLVRSNIRDSARNRPEELMNAPAAPPAGPAGPPPGGGGGVDIMDFAMDPLEAGEKVLRGVRRNDLFILTHPEFYQGISDRCDVLLASVPVGEPEPEGRVNASRGVLRAPIYLAEKERLGI